MADQIIDIPGVGQVAFPDSMDDAAISAAAARLYKDAGEPGSSPASGSSASPGGEATASALGLGAAAPVIERLGMELATSPKVRRIPGVIGYGGTGVAVVNDLRRGEYGRAASDAVLGGGGTALAKAASEGALRGGGRAAAAVGRVLGRAALPLQVAATGYDLYQLTTPESRAAMAAGRERVAAADAASGRKDARDMDRSRQRRKTTAEIARDEINKRK